MWIADGGLRIELTPPIPQSEIANPQLAFRRAPLRSHSPGPPNRVEPQAPFVLHAARDHRVGRVPRRGSGRDPGHERPRCARARRRSRSEEHTSELQSPCNLVCRLLLEKKKDADAAT